MSLTKLVNGKRVPLSPDEVAEHNVRSQGRADELKISLKKIVKQEAARRIEALYPDFKQRNILGEVTKIQNKEILAIKSGGTYTLTADEQESVASADACEAFISGVRTSSNQIEISIDTKTEEELESFDPTDESLW